MLCLKVNFGQSLVNYNSLLSFSNDVNKNGSHLLAAVLIDSELLCFVIEAIIQIVLIFIDVLNYVSMLRLFTSHFFQYGFYFFHVSRAYIIIS
jgi:hypothetical protein